MRPPGPPRESPGPTEPRPGPFRSPLREDEGVTPPGSRSFPPHPNTPSSESMAKPIHVQVTRRVQAPAERVYDILSDYHHGHRLILPARVFQDLSVERGGRGEGTVIRFAMKAFGTVKKVRATIDEPVPGRVLVERIEDGTGVVTTFTVAPRPKDQTEVTISTTWIPQGFQGLFERLFAPPFLKRLYVEELGNLEKVATGAL